MKVTAEPQSQHLSTACYKSTCLAAMALYKAGTQDEEHVAYATIDGHMVPHLEVASAVTRGSGIFIGDYFVGFADNHQTVSLAPFIRY